MLQYKGLFKDYSQMVEKLAKPGSQLFFQGNKRHAVHMLIGLISEQHEINHVDGRDNAIEEIGDCMFYLFGLADVFSVRIPEDISFKEPSICTMDVLSRLSDHVKKWAVYNKSANIWEIEEEILVFHRHLNYKALLWGTTLNYCMERNMEKLLIGNGDTPPRYGEEGYSDQKAQERNDKGGEE